MTCCDPCAKCRAEIIKKFVAEDPVRRAAQRWVDLFDFVHDYDAGAWWREADAAWNDLKTALAGDAQEGET